MCLLASVLVYLMLECPTVAEQLQCPFASSPDFNLTVNKSSKSVTVFMEPGHSVYALVTYNRTSLGDPLIINSSVSRRSAVLSVPYILPCLCIEVYYTCPDSRRRAKCPLENSTLLDVMDVWNTTKFRLKSTSLTMILQCRAAQINMTSALCWRHGGHCTVVFDLRVLEKVTGRKREYNTTDVDKHPDMCLQRLLQGSQNISCHFKDEVPSWTVHIEIWRQSVFIHINSSVPAKFSAQLCKLSQSKCAAVGRIQSLNTKCTIATIQLPVLSVEEEPCVQIWQSEPALHGKRILCPEYARGRYGVYTVAALLCGIMVTALGIFFYHIHKKDPTGWFCIQQPVLIVCSSEDSVHISAVCALASILQEDLGATVHLALWAQSTQSQCGLGVTDVGPLPWLYGQWDTVVKAQGHVLIIWSLDATIAYKKWCSDKESVKNSKQKDFRPCKIEETTTLIGKYKLKKEDRSRRTEVTEPCTVIVPVFKAALNCLMGALQANKLQKVSFIRLHGCSSRSDIPKAFGAAPRYCLPRQFSRLIQELGVTRRLSENSRLHCWTKLLSKVLCFWLAQQLARRLQTVLPPK